MMRIYIILLFFNPSDAADNFQVAPLIDGVLNSMHKVVRFFSKYEDKLNVDCLFGLRSLQGDIEYITQYRHSILPSQFLQSLLKFHNEISVLSDNVLRKFLQKPISHYDHYLAFMVTRAMPPFRGSYSEYRNVQMHLKYPNISYDSNFNEQKSDKCFKELYPDPIDESHQILQNNKCRITGDCVKLMLLKRGQKEYYITHQVLYAYFVRQFRCQGMIEPALTANRLSLSLKEDELCSNLYIQLQEKLMRLNFDVSKANNIDILLEEICVCARLGFMQFLNVSLLPDILKYQDVQLGCFESSVRSKEKVILRRALMEVEVTDEVLQDCSFHISSVALATLSSYLRFSLDPDTGSFTDPKLLYGKRSFLDLWWKELHDQRDSFLPRLLQSQPFQSNEPEDSNQNVKFAPSFLPFLAWKKIRHLLAHNTFN